MRFYEWLTLGYYLLFAALAWKRPIAARRRYLITGAAAAGSLILLLFRSSALQDWLPLAFIPLAYWQTGYFVLPLSERVQTALHSLDQKFLRGVRVNPSVSFWLELAYLCVYPLVPLGLIALFASGNGRYAGEFWNVVIPPAYLCYATFPFLQTLPPRSFEKHLPEQTKIRTANLFVLRHVSIQANTFPSGHVAASLAIALELLRHTPAFGAAFLIVAIAIASGAFLGRYHYGLDVLIGAALAVISFLANPNP